MRDLKLKHYFLYSVAFLLLLLAEIPFGAIIAFILWQQLALYLWRVDFSKKSQLASIGHSLTLLPLLLLLGAAYSFFIIYLKNLAFIPLIFSSILCFTVGLLLVTFGISFFLDWHPEATVYGLLTKAIHNLKKRKVAIFKLSLFFILAATLLWWIPADYALVLALVLTHIMGKHYLKMPVHVD